MKIAIVTGASSGMGKEFVRQIERFYRELDEIWVIARSEKKLEEIKKSHKTYIRIFAGDMEEDLVYKQVKNRLENQNPDIRMLVNAAGFGKTGTVEEIAKEDKKLQLRMIDLNCKALLLMTRLCVPYMQPGSHILELDSLSAFQPVPYITTYAATKAFVLSYSRSMNRELKAKGIRVMAMNPGWVKTEFFNHAFQTNADNEVRYFNRLYEAKDVVKTGLNDLYHSKKDCSIHGFPVKFQVFLVKLLPHSLVMNTWLNQQKKAKNNKGLTTK